MSKDSKREKKNIFELIEEMCPDGVEYRRLGDCCKIETGRLNANAAVEDGKYPFFTTAQEISHIDSYRWDTEALMIAGNANVGDVKYYNGKFNAYQRTYVLTDFIEILMPRFLFYVMKNNLKSYLEDHKHEAAMTYIVLGSLQAFEIPVPPLAVQREVVRVLDTMTELTTELTAELTARTKQYAYYRDELLKLEGVEGVEYMKLGDVTTQRRGKGLKKDDKGSGDTAIILYGELYTTYGDYITDIASRCDDGVATGALPLFYGDILLPISSTTRKAQIGKASVLKVSEPVYLGGDAVALTPKDGILPDYMMYCINGMAFEEQKMKCVKGTTIQHLSPSMMYDIEIPVPPLQVQQDIVTRLDAFSSYCTDLTLGLPAEIEARNKQYAYYRDLLLSFPPAQHSLFSV